MSRQTIQDITNEILQEVESGVSMEKTASTISPEFSSEISKMLFKVASDLRHSHEQGVEVTYEDVLEFSRRIPGVKI